MAIHGAVVEKSLFNGQSTYITQECRAGTYFDFRGYVLRCHYIPPITNEPLKHCQRAHFANFATAQIEILISDIQEQLALLWLTQILDAGLLIGAIGRDDKVSNTYSDPISCKSEYVRPISASALCQRHE